MSTQKPRILVTLEEPTAALLKRFCRMHYLTMSELIAAIVEPVAMSIAWELKYGEGEQPSLFPDALLDLYLDEPYRDRQEAQGRLQEAFDALRRNREKVVSLGYGGAAPVASEDGATAPPAAAAAEARPSRPSRPTPVSNTGVTSPKKGNQTGTKAPPPPSPAVRKARRK